MSSRHTPTIVARAPVATSEKTVIVLGAFRGGTSLVSQIAQYLGVPMGEHFSYEGETPSECGEYLNFEDVEFQSPLHDIEFLLSDPPTPSSEADDRIERVRDVIARRDAKYPVWGFKYPATAWWMVHTNLVEDFRNPVFISIFRDPVAVARHELEVGSLRAEEIGSQPGPDFLFVERQYRILADHVRVCQHPHLLVSYERAISRKDVSLRELIRNIASFLQLVVTESDVTTVLAKIKRGRQG